MTTDTAPIHTASRSLERSERSSARAGGIGGIVAAATFIFGIAMYATTFVDYTSGDFTPAESAEFVADHQGSLFAWYLVIYLVFGAAIVPLARALHRRVVGDSPALADIGAVFAYVWTGLMFATGMIHNIGIDAISDLLETDPDRAATLWVSVATIADGLGGGNELVGGAWLLLVSIAAWGSRALPRWLNVLGGVSGASGLITVIPGLEDVGMIFGLGCIVWFAGAGVVLLRNPQNA